MNIGIIGVNFKSADLFFREKLALNLQSNGSSLDSYLFTKVVVSTCNRFEIYFSSEDLTATHSFLLQKFREAFETDCGFKLYSYFGKDCFLHLTQVTTGLDSAVLAETEIQGQVKRAYLKALEQPLSKELHFIFQKSLKIGKLIRSQIDLKPGTPNLITTLLDALQTLLKIYTTPKILFVGASEINTKIIHQIDKHRFDVTLCSRNIQRAAQKAGDLQIKSIPWEKLTTWHEYDGLVFATNYSKYLIEGKSFQTVTEKIVFDLSVPRNVHPALSENKNIKLLNIDQINKIVRRHRKLGDHTICDIKEQVQGSVFHQCEIFKNKNQFTENLKSVV